MPPARRRGDATPLLVSPRSVALHTRRVAKEKRVEATRRRWALVRANIWRLAREERQRLGLPEPHEVSGAPSSAWAIGLSHWKDRAAEVTLRSLALLKPISESEVRALLAYTSVVTYTRYPQVHRRGTPVTSCFLSSRLIRLVARAAQRRADLAASGRAARVAWVEAGAFAAAAPDRRHPHRHRDLPPAVRPARHPRCGGAARPAPCRPRGAPRRVARRRVEGRRPPPLDAALARAAGARAAGDGAADAPTPRRPGRDPHQTGRAR